MFFEIRERCVASVCYIEPRVHLSSRTRKIFFEKGECVPNLALAFTCLGC